MDDHPLETTQSSPIAHRKKGLFLWTILTMATIGVYLIPYGKYALYPFRLLYSFLHQMAFGFSNLIMGGSFKDLSLHWDGNGGAYTIFWSTYDFPYGLIALGGLLGPLLFSILCFVLSRNAKASRIGLYVFTAFCAFSIIAYVHNFLGIVFVGLAGFCAFSIALLSKAKSIPRYAMLILAITSCAGIFSHGDYIFFGHNIADYLSNKLFLPPMFWTITLTIVSVLVLMFGVMSFFHTKPED